tara:strand:+ start:2132 stop:7066 length:4935 start_codon:yes stop_codon:yes gene_type:complete
MNSIEPQIIDIFYYSLGFPNRDWKNLIERDNFISEINSIFENSKDVIFLSGQDDIGKTTFCGQYCKKNPTNTISVFFNQYNSLDLTVDFLRMNIFYQIQFLLGNEIENDGEYISSEMYRLAFFNLRKKFRRTTNKIILVVDGLENRGSSSNEAIKKILDEIPFGEDNLKILISGSSEEYSEKIEEIKKINFQNFSLVGFTQHQLKEYLGTENFNKINDSDLIKITKNYPGRLEVLKRLLEEGIELKKIGESNNYQNWIDLDISKINIEEPVTSVLLSLMALTDKTFSVNDIKLITGYKENIIQEALKNIHIVKIENLSLKFISTAHANYINNILRANKIKIEKLLIKFYGSNRSLDNTYQLSKLYAKQKKWKEITELIDTNFIEGTINSTGSIERVNETINLGFKSCEQMKSYPESYRFSVQGSIVNELDNYQFWESEILARIALKDFRGAVNLAEKAILKIDRLRLLSLVAKKEKQINNKVDEELTKLINNLYQNTNLNNAGENLYDIVSNLIYAIPNLAIEIIENSSGTASESDINDWIVAKLSIAAINSNAKNDEKNVEDKKLQALQKLNNPSVRKIHTAISFMVGNYSGKKVLDEVKKLKDNNEKLKLLRLWLKNNRKYKQNLPLVLDRAFELTISTADESESILETLTDLSFQLRNIKDHNEIEKVLTKFNKILPGVEKDSSKRGYYTLKLNLFYSQNQIGKDRAMHQLDETIKKIDDLEDILIKLESYSEVFQKLSLIKDIYYKEYYNKIFGKIKFVLREVLMNSADHKKILKNTLRIISKVEPILGLKICKKLNILNSRDKGRMIVLDAYLDNSIRNINLNNVKQIISEIEYSPTKEIALLHILERFSASKTLPKIVIKELLFFIQQLDKKDFGSYKLQYLLLSLDIISKNSFWKNKLESSLKQKTLKSWNECNSEWDKIDLGFLIASETAEIDEKFAQNVFQDSIELKKIAWLDSNSVADTYLNCLRLVIRSFTPLMKNDVYNKRDITNLTSLINRISSELDKIRLWTELTFNAIFSNQIDLAKSFYNNHIFPIIQNNINHNYKIQSIIDSLIVMHYFNTELAIEHLEKLPLNDKEDACIRISDFYLTNKSPFEIYEGEKNSDNTNYDSIFKAVNILKLVETDNIIFIILNDICNSLKESKLINDAQKIDIKNRLSELINKNLPDKNNIVHNGYKILASAQIENIIKNSSCNWETFLMETECINNLSDRIFIYANLLEYIPFNKINNPDYSKEKIFDKIVLGLNSLNSHYEYITRILSMSKIMFDVNKTKWKKIVNEAFIKSYGFEEGIEMYNYQKEILDKMYSLDSDFAKTLINEQIEPEKYFKNKKLLRDYYDMLEMSNKIKNNLSIKDIEKENHRIIIRAMMKALGSLNSGKITTKKVSDVSKYLSISKNIPLGESLPIYMFFLANSSNLKLIKSRENQITDSQRKTFENMINASNIIEILSQKRKFDEDFNQKVFIDDDFVNNLVVPPGTKEEAMNFIRDWIEEQAEDFLIICDPYFSKYDLEILKVIKETKAEIDIHILGSENGDKPNIADEFKKHWKSISEEIPPYTDITFCWIEGVNAHPIHDRWIISKNGGLRLGTSFNGLGQKKESEISVITTNEAFNIKSETLNDYLTRKKKYLNQQRVSYSGFTL